MKAVEGYFLIKPEDLTWRLSNLMKIPNADFLERTKSENMGARLWRLPPHSANTLHKHIRAEEFYFVVEGVGRIRIGDETLTVPKHADTSHSSSILLTITYSKVSSYLFLITIYLKETQKFIGVMKQKF